MEARARCAGTMQPANSSHGSANIIDAPALLAAALRIVHLTKANAPPIRRDARATQHGQGRPCPITAETTTPPITGETPRLPIKDARATGPRYTPHMTALKDTSSTRSVSFSSPVNQSAAVFQTDLPLSGRRQGKVRDIYSVPPAAAGQPPRMLIIASDRISAFDVVMPTPIPGKGKLLTEISLKWFEFIRSRRIVADHLLSSDPADVPGLNAAQRTQLEGRMMLTRAAKVVPIECVVRGYLAGSGWVEYKQSQTVCGIKLPAGLRQCDRLPEPIFTPATKEDVGHDENIDFERACSIAGRDVMTKLRDISLGIYSDAAKHSESRGIILADTKFEFGWALDQKGNPTSELILIDEVLTPDSSRFWPADEYQPGRDQNSFDKQYLRNYLLELVAAGTWHKQPPGPELPQHIVQNTLAKYVDARDRLFA